MRGRGGPGDFFPLTEVMPLEEAAEVVLFALPGVCCVGVSQAPWAQTTDWD